MSDLELKDTTLTSNEVCYLDTRIRNGDSNTPFHLSVYDKRDDFSFRIRKFLSVSSAKALVHAFVTCRLDNCNSLLYGLPKHLVHRLQLAQNCVARLILCGRKHDHVTPLLKELRWLPVEQRIIFKILLFTFKALNNLCPRFITVIC